MRFRVSYTPDNDDCRYHENRLDLADWVVHFVHEKKPESFWTDDDGNQLLKPVAYDERGRGVFTSYQKYRDDDQVWEMTPFEVLLQIISDGYLHTTWSERGRRSDEMRPTVYGPRSAVCFTEMPLHALIEYQSQRATSGYVAKYAIALKRNEFFENGGRSVIYGLTGEHAEAIEGDPHYNRSARNLASSCGISLKEQYGYVAMKLGGNRLIDWSHEREWRWTKAYTRDSSLPGLPLWTVRGPFVRKNAVRMALRC